MTREALAQDPNTSAVSQAFASVMTSLERDIEHEMYREAARTSAAFVIEKMITALPIRASKYGEVGRLDLLEHAVRGCALEDGAYVEFGVFQGESLGFIADRIDGVVYGFDSFRGLPEDWFMRVGKGSFTLGGVAPYVGCAQQNYRILTGDFADTLPTFLKAVTGKMAFVHIDCCLYSSARTVLEALADRIVPGTVVVFDEYLNYPGWQAHEHRALTEFSKQHKRPFSYFAFTPAYHSVAIRFT